MKTVMMAALAAVQVPAAGPAPSEPPREERVAQQKLAERGSLPSTDERVELALAGDQAGEPGSAQPEAARQEKPRKRKSTGDKVLTGAAVVLGIGALAVGGLLIAIFVN